MDDRDPKVTSSTIAPIWSIPTGIFKGYWITAAVFIVLTTGVFWYFYTDWFKRIVLASAITTVGITWAFFAVGGVNWILNWRRKKHRDEGARGVIFQLAQMPPEERHQYLDDLKKDVQRGTKT